MTSQRSLELIPFAPPRVVGPGRREREYRARVAALEGALGELTTKLGSGARELETSQRLERGCQRMLDRLERRSDVERARIARLEQQQKRLILALGAAQREIELTRERLALAEGRAAPERAPVRRLPRVRPA